MKIKKIFTITILLLIIFALLSLIITPSEGNWFWRLPPLIQELPFIINDSVRYVMNDWWLIDVWDPDIEDFEEDDPEDDPREDRLEGELGDGDVALHRHARDHGSGGRRAQRSPPIPQEDRSFLETAGRSREKPPVPETARCVRGGAASPSCPRSCERRVGSVEAVPAPRHHSMAVVVPRQQRVVGPTAALVDLAACLRRVLPIAAESDPVQCDLETLRQR